MLRVVVADTGRGFAETLGTGVGLTNIRERLAALYGDLQEYADLEALLSALKNFVPYL